MEKTSNTSKIKENKYLYVASIGMLLYSFIEISDSIAIMLIALHFIPNLYLTFNLSIPFMQQLIETQPLSFAPFFWAFTTMRIVSTIGLFKNLSWGFWIGMGSILITMILTILFLPIGAFELLACAILFMLLVIGYCKDKPII